MIVLPAQRECLLFGETDGAWVITTYLEKGRGARAVDRGQRMCYFKKTGMKPGYGIEIPKLFIAGKSIYIGML